MDRRELLRYFGIGATITPMLNGAAVVEAAATLLRIPEVRPVALASTFPDGHEPPERYAHRVKWNPHEAIWLRFWQIENNPPPFLNSGIGPLEHIVDREPTEDEKAVACGIMQWFGTNCGHCFIEETLRAQGYRLVYDRSLPNVKEIEALKHHNVWHKPEGPQEVRISRRGQQIVLRPNDAGFVSPV